MEAVVPRGVEPYRAEHATGSRPTVDPFRLDGKIALVTGAGRGIGEAIAVRFAEAGASVAVLDVDAATSRSTVRRIAHGNGRAFAIPADISRPGESRRAVEAVVGEFGRLDVLVNNAGIFPFAPALEVSESLWSHVLAVNLSGSFFLAQAAAHVMVKEGVHGAIVNIASVDAFRPTGGLAHYDASKAGLVMLTRSLAFELGPRGIRVNAVAPGSIDTPGARAATPGPMPGGADASELLKAFLARIPLGRMGTPDDIAHAAVYLASPASAYVTGATLIVDGGYLCA
ncbi:MAG TPA: SDR family oxidoreductase [Thermoplasmata archaeon]|nr:SDR family oxidoreductase [Thermoplasmata archaeon]